MGGLSGPSVMKGLRPRALDPCFSEQALCQWPRKSLQAGQVQLAMLVTPEFSVTAWITTVIECTDCKHTSAPCLP